MAKAIRSTVGEASGVAGPHVRNREAELKLKSAEQNLARVEELKSQIEARVRELRRQARHAMRYQNLSNTILSAEAELLAIQRAATNSNANSEDKARKHLERLTRKLEEMGPVNLRAEIEASEAEEAIATLEHDRAAITSAIAKLRASSGYPRQGFTREDREQLQRTAEGAMHSIPQLLFGIAEPLLFVRVNQPIGAGAVTTILQQIARLGGGGLLWEADSSDANLIQNLQRLGVSGQSDSDFEEKWRGLKDTKISVISLNGRNIYCIFTSYSIDFSDGASFIREHFGVQNWGAMQENEDKKQEISKHREALAKHIVEDASDDEILALMLLHKKLAFKKKHRNTAPPKWGDPNLSDELKRLTAPLFLKRVYNELIVCGTIEKQTIREFDKTLMAYVEQYISARERNNRGPGDEAGVTFISYGEKKRGPRRSPAQPPRTEPRSGRGSLKRKLILG